MAKTKVEEIKENIKDITITEFANTKYREYWENVNQNKNAFFPEEQLVAVNRHLCWAAYKIGMKPGFTVKTPYLTGEIIKTHVSGDQGVNDSIALAAQGYRRQIGSRLLRGEGNLGSFPGDPGAASRYTQVECTPLLHRIIKDMKYMNTYKDPEGTEMVEWVSAPIPMMLVNGVKQVGDGRSCYMAERNINEIIDWLEDTSKPAPQPMSSLGCKTYYNPNGNGFIVYEAEIKKNLKISGKRGKWDEIVGLPPGLSVQNAIKLLKDKLPKNVGNKVEDNIGDGNFISIYVPAGHLDDKKVLSKLKLYGGRKEYIYVWDRNLNTMRETDLKEVADVWLESRQEIVSRRINDIIDSLKSKIHRTDLIQTYVDKGMSDWKVEDIENELGKDDANIVLSTSARAFLPESLAKNKKDRKEWSKDIKKNQEYLKNIKDFVLNEAREVIKEQEEFFTYHDQVIE